jgi:hypothetical protein
MDFSNLPKLKKIEIYATNINNSFQIKPSSSLETLISYNTDFNNGGVDFLKFEVGYKCDGLKDILKNMYPCKTDLSKVDNSPSPISDTLS